MTTVGLDSRIDQVEAYDLRLPLMRPYNWSQGRITALSTQLVVVRIADATGVGECTTVPGYSREDPEQAWQFIREQGDRIVGLPSSEAFDLVRAYVPRYPFACSALLMAIEMTRGYGYLTVPDGAARIRLLGTVNVDELGEIPQMVERLLAAGYATLKVKVGFDIEHDLAKAHLVQSTVCGRALIRFDANQSYNLSDARTFTRSIDPLNVEVFEQPFGPGAWEEMAGLAAGCPVPLMLDESIYSVADIERAAGLKCAQFVKLKLMKAGGAEDLVTAVRAARELGFQVVLGNGAAAEVGCYHEALIAAYCAIRTAGEMNGFLKLRESTLVRHIEVKGPDIVLRPGFTLRLAVDRLRQLAHRTVTWNLARRA